MNITNSAQKKMTADAMANDPRKRSDKPVAGEEGLKVVTVECLRGRLLAERNVSRNARQEAEQIENKLIELEKKLTEESKLRNRVEKRLKYLMKKLNSLNLSYAFEEEGDRSAASFENTEISTESSSSVISSNTKRTSEFTANFSDSTNSDVAVSIKNSNSSLNLCQNDSQNPPFEIHAAQSVELGSGVCNGDSTKMDDRLTSKEEEEEGVDNSLALVVVEMTKKKQSNSIDPEILDSNVKQVLDALRHAKEQLQTSMETRRRSFILLN